MRRGEFHHSDGLTEGRALLSMPAPPTAIFASSDVQALGVYEAAPALGVAIPSEVSVVGFDDLKIARWAGPALTTIRVPIAEMAEQAVQVVLGLGQERAPAFSRVEMATTRWCGTAPMFRPVGLVEVPLIRLNLGASAWRSIVTSSRRVALLSGSRRRRAELTTATARNGVPRSPPPRTA